MARHPRVLRDPAQQGPGATGNHPPLLPRLPQRSSNQPCSTPSASRNCLFPAHVNEAAAAIRRYQRFPDREPTRRRLRTSPRPLPCRWRIASKLTFSKPSPPRCSGVGAPVGRSEEEDDSMMKQHALRVPCWLSAGPWRLARGGRTWIVRQSNAMWHGDALAVFVSHFRLPGELCIRG